MKDQYLRLLKDTFKDISHLSPEKVRNLIDETTLFFKELQEKLKSPDEKAHKEAEEAAIAVRVFLEDQMAKVIDASGLSPEDFLAQIADPSKLTEQDRELITEAQEKLQATHGAFPKKKKKGKGKKQRLIG